MIKEICLAVEMNKDNFKPDESHDVIIACIVSGGPDRGIAGKYTGEQVVKIHAMLEEIASWLQEGSVE